MHIQCTKKMLDFLKPDIVVKNTDDDFYAWHADYLVVFRKKLFVFMNDLTRYCVVLYGLKKSDFKDFAETFRLSVGLTMEWQGYDPDLVQAYVDKIDVVTYDKTKNRKLVARLNRAMFDLSWSVEDYLRDYEVEQPRLAEELNMSPVGENQWKIHYFPYDKMREYLNLLR